MNAYEINLAIRGLQSLESELCREWEIAQKARPYGAKATGIFHELRELRSLADKLSNMHETAEA